jgi:hypothetical protein
MRKLVAVPHSKIKARLEEEKREKQTRTPKRVLANGKSGEEGA